MKRFGKQIFAAAVLLLLLAAMALPCFAAGTAYAEAFIDNAGGVLKDSEVSAKNGNLLIGEFIVLIVALVIGFAVAGVFAYRMNNARRGRNAANYVKDNSFALNKSADLYLFSTVTKTRVQSQSSGGGHSGGGSSRSSSHSRF